MCMLSTSQHIQVDGLIPKGMIWDVKPKVDGLIPKGGDLKC